MGSSSAYIRRADAQKYLTEIEAAKLKGTWVDPKQSPCRGVPLPKVEHEEMRYLNPAEIADGRQDPLGLPGAGVRRRLRRAAHRGAGGAAPLVRRLRRRHRRRGRDGQRAEGQAGRRAA
jgi:hypothetical protein